MSSPSMRGWVVQGKRVGLCVAPSSTTVDHMARQLSCRVGVEPSQATVLASVHPFNSPASHPPLTYDPHAPTHPRTHPPHQGGVAGGSILKGILKIGDEIEVRPGIVTKSSDGKIQCSPIYTRVVSLFAEDNDLQVRS